jgi:hypothetical protein
VGFYFHSIRTLAPLHALRLKLSFYLDDWLLRNASRHSEKTDEVVHQEFQIGRIDYEPGEVGIDSFPGFHIHRDSLLHPCGTNVPPPDRIVKIMSTVRQLSALKFRQAREFLSLLGLLNSAADQVPHGRLHLRPHQLLLLSKWRPHRDPLDWEVPLMIDLFAATKMNNRLPQYMSSLPEPKALAVNALAVSWDGKAFPPTPLIQAVLNKVMTDKIRLCLIAPCWPSQAWFPTLLELLTDHPRRLPEWDLPLIKSKIITL